jgi:hypothetical protein
VRSLRTLREGRIHQRERGREQECAGRSLERPAGHEQYGLHSQPPSHRREPEHDEGADPHVPPSEQIGGPTAQEQEAPEGQGVRADHPLDPAVGESER